MIQSWFPHNAIMEIVKVDRSQEFRAVRWSLLILRPLPCPKAEPWITADGVAFTRVVSRIER